MNTEGIEDMVKEYDGNVKALTEELLRICWFMRGGIGYNESYLLSSDDRQIIGKIIEKNLDTTKESGLPFF